VNGSSAAIDSGAAQTQGASRYVVGIDLGTTNCAVAFVDSHRGGDRAWQVETFLIPQWVDWGQAERRSTLPSFHYELPAELAPSLASGLPWQQRGGEEPVRPGVVPTLRQGATGDGAVCDLS
jgi:hypothetical protein